MSKYLIKNYPIFYELFAEKLLRGTELAAQLNKETVIHYYTKWLME